ncbi:DUF4384 domain-containing protein [Lacihabitans sp. LS3-19]|uniref:C1 family peptidase n=1 Tax=Lacihabitans sp. LS3-19 TaxID=2487335 RepID=UPI0020CD4300|nr:C1 family peptidase [Lacihabitans sp. LS3-19]MCP9766441.1 DUF4384 domain-containing protein [Lacihabitans sp. LS3-19]
MKKSFLFFLLSIVFLNFAKAQIYVLETQGQIFANGKSLKKGDEVSGNQKLNFAKESKLNILTPDGFVELKGSIPNVNTTKVGVLIRQNLVNSSKSTRSFGGESSVNLESELSTIMAILDGNSKSFDENYGNFIEPYLKSRFDNETAKKAFDFLQKKYDKSPPTLTGLLSSESQYQSVPQITRLTQRSYSSLPERYSLKEYCPVPGLQQFGDCVGWSSTYAARTILYAIRNNIRDKQAITSQTFAPSFTYGQIRANPNDATCKQGSYINDAVKLIKDLGSVKFNEFEYSCSPAISKQAINAASKFRIKNYRRLSGDYNADRTQMMESIKKSISEKRPVVIAMEVYESFQRPSANATKGLWEGKKGKMVSRHAITVVSYDDTKFGGAFEIINSWGTYWGNEGFMWLTYKDFAQVVYEAYEMADFEASSPLVDYSKTELSGSFKVILENNNEMAVKVIESASSSPKSVENINYQATKPYNSGTKFRLGFTNNQPAYIYILSYGTNTQKVDAIFPFDGFSAYLDYSKNEVVIPNEDYWVQMDNNVGTDFLCILFSKEELDIKAIAKQMQRQSGSFDNKLKAVLSDKMVENGNIKPANNKISFEASLKGKSLVPITLQIKHVN